LLNSNVALGTNSDVDLLVGHAVSEVLSDRQLQGIASQRGMTSRSSVQGAVMDEMRSLATFFQQNPSNQISISSTGNLLQVNSGGRSYNVDPLFAPIVKEVLPVIVSSGYSDPSGQFRLDMTRSRFGGSTNIHFNGGNYVGLIPASRNKASIKSRAQQIGQSAAAPYVQNPSFNLRYPNVQTPRYNYNSPIQRSTQYQQSGCVNGRCYRN
jgi:hypothetical protein